METLFENFIRSLRACSNCGNCIGNTDFFCDPCWLKIEAQILNRNEQSIGGYPFEVNALFIWKHGNDQIVKKMIYNLKGGVTTGFYRRLLSYFEFPEVRENTVIVPAPAKNINRHPDHAGVWAQAISEHTGLRVLQILRCTSEQSQKAKTAEDRYRISFMVDQAIGEENIIFVDDVVTTGSTVEAAYKALGKPRSFKVWCIVCNPKRNYC